MACQLAVKLLSELRNQRRNWLLGKHGRNSLGVFANASCLYLQSRQVTVNLPVFDAIVVGAGIIGSACAYHLAKNKQKTILLEQFPLPHSRGSSHGQSRIIRYAYPQDFYTHMMLDAYPMWDSLSQEAGVRLFKQCGLLNLGVEEGEFLTSIASAMSRHRLDFKKITSQKLKECFPMLNYPATYGAVLDPKAGILFADKALAAYQSIFKLKGGLLYDGELVKTMVPTEPLITVVTSKGQYCGKNLILAAGPWSPTLLRTLGLILPLERIRATVCYWREKQLGSHHSDHFPCIIESKESSQGDNFMAYTLPSEEYSGLVKNTPDENPVIDRLPEHKNIIIATGFSGHGFKLAPAVGKAVMEMVLNKEPSYNMKPFVFSRFTDSHSQI